MIKIIKVKYKILLNQQKQTHHRLTRVLKAYLQSVIALCISRRHLIIMDQVYSSVGKELILFKLPI